MFPAAQGVRLDIEAISGIMGSISIACWLVVFSPQIIENFRRSSTEGLSIFFVIIWLTGDVFNVLGAVLQGVLPTMIILAVYYAFADTVLLSQIFFYRGFKFSDRPISPTLSPTITNNNNPDEEDIADEQAPLKHAHNGATSLTIDSPSATTPAPEPTISTERTRLLIPPPQTSTSHRRSSNRSPTSPSGTHPGPPPRRSSSLSIASALSATSISAVHLSPATPLLPPPSATSAPAARNLTPVSTFQSILFNLAAILLVCAAGVFGWYLSVARHTSTSLLVGGNQGGGMVPGGGGGGGGGADAGGGGGSGRGMNEDELELDLWGQVFGYLCASFYLGSRLPQLLLNWRRKSTEGVSMLFFLFACVGNLTYVLSIFAWEPGCARGLGVGGGRGGGGSGLGRLGGVEGLGGLGGLGGRRMRGICEEGEWREMYGRWILVNLSWLLGSAGTFVLDLGVFAQFWMYRGNVPEGQVDG